MILLVVTPLILTTFLQNTADAKSRTCVRLERQLASLSNRRTTGNPLKLLRYNGAIKRQKRQIQQANRQLRRGGCSRPAPRNARSCQRLKASLRSMNSNLKKLRAQRGRFSPGGRSTSREKRRIKNALKANRCDQLRPVIATNRSGIVIERGAGRRSVIQQIFGDERRNWERQNRSRNREYYNDEFPGTRRPRGGTYRTLCVRTCDGYYFPISFSTTPRNFGRDADACSAKCPGTETELYSHSTNGEGPEDMVSTNTQQPYKELATAFSYRTAVTPGCGCKFKQINYEAIAGEGNEDDREPAKQAPIVATPTFRIDVGDDPDTLQNRRGNFVPRQIFTKNSKPGKRKIRVVGEAFFPGQ